MVTLVVQSKVDRANYPKRVDISATPATPIILRNTMRGVKMKQIELTSPKYPDAFTIIDDKDVELVSQHKWRVSKSHQRFYAYANIKCGQKWSTLQMHRLILDAKKGQIVDHVNCDGLDNRRVNLRFCTASQNNQNQASRGGTSLFKGVSRNNKQKKWMAKIKKDRKVFYLGLFDNEKDAAIAYDNAAKKLFVDFAWLNFPAG